MPWGMVYGVLSTPDRKTKNRPAPLTTGPGRRHDSRGSHLGVPRIEHGGEPGRLLFAPASFARLFVVPVVADDPQHALAVQLLLQPPQGLVNRFSFFESDLAQGQSHPLQRPPEPSPPMAQPRSPVKGHQPYAATAAPVNGQNQSQQSGGFPGKTGTFRHKPGDTRKPTAHLPSNLRANPASNTFIAATTSFHRSPCAPGGLASQQSIDPGPTKPAKRPGWDSATRAMVPFPRVESKGVTDPVEAGQRGPETPWPRAAALDQSSHGLSAERPETHRTARQAGCRFANASQMADLSASLSLGPSHNHAGRAGKNSGRG